MTSINSERPRFRAELEVHTLPGTELSPCVKNRNLCLVLFASMSPLINILSGWNLSQPCWVWWTQTREEWWLLRAINRKHLVGVDVNVATGGGHNICVARSTWADDQLYVLIAQSFVSPLISEDGHRVQSVSPLWCYSSRHFLPSPHTFTFYIKLCSHGTEIDIFMFYKNTTAKWQKCYNLK